MPLRVRGRSLMHAAPSARFVPCGAQDMLEEDDEFEEFEQESWDVAAEDAEDQQLWQEGWDEDDAEGEFTQQLRAELAKHASS